MSKWTISKVDGLYSDRSLKWTAFEIDAKVDVEHLVWGHDVPSGRSCQNWTILSQSGWSFPNWTILILSYRSLVKVNGHLKKKWNGSFMIHTCIRRFLESLIEKIIKWTWILIMDQFICYIIIFRNLFTLDDSLSWKVSCRNRGL